jgi:hypothetical protein
LPLNSDAQSIYLKSDRSVNPTVGQNQMIDWRISPEFEGVKEREWFFPTFELQEYLLPQINVGKAFIDEYDDTTFTTDDCVRLKGNIEYLIDCGVFDQKKEIRFDSLSRGIVTLSSEQIKSCLLRLHDAADQAVKRGGILKFYGD